MYIVYIRHLYALKSVPHALPNPTIEHLPKSSVQCVCRVVPVDLDCKMEA